MTPHGTRLVTINGVQAKLIIDEKQQVSVLRSLTGTTPTDTLVDELPLPAKPLWLRLIVRALKWYRTKLASSIGLGCVYEPSCSRYAELALRQHGFRKGFYSTLKRLHRCRPGAGGVDLP
ncbi:membrane protein insertion efficiency factor YidD [Spirosoma sp.]|uniref:membrane protein insertion efficiency factor YidD n=1 Tax=Spirosoma sp. TaxID=1899569 RepID=UPI002623AF46|nr:membrane protein insertion efficiency factor YidD [Spirosoma sp.]MCX6212863.1 membrane protein insertion efficiency factor YidD [Spirosoma sp.]